MRRDRHLAPDIQALSTQTDGAGRPNVVAAVDGSVAGYRALEYAAGLACRRLGHLTIVYVYQPPLLTAVTSGIDTAFQPVDLTEYSNEIVLELGQLARNEYGIEARIEFRKGDPAIEISVVADDLHADVVVVGAPHSFLHRHTGWSIPAWLVRHARWPLIIVP